MDEAQYEVTKDLIRWKRFETEEAAIEFKKENQLWAGPLHTERGIFLGNSILDEILAEAIIATNTHYKLEVPLGVEAAYGRNWFETH